MFIMAVLLEYLKELGPHSYAELVGDGILAHVYYDDGVSLVLVYQSDRTLTLNFGVGPPTSPDPDHELLERNFSSGPPLSLDPDHPGLLERLAGELARVRAVLAAGAPDT